MSHIWRQFPKTPTFRHGLPILVMIISWAALSCQSSTPGASHPALTTVRAASPMSVVEAPDNAALDKEFQYLNAAMDRYYDVFYLYSDADSGGNHYYPSFLYNGPQSASVVSDCHTNPHLGKTCIWIHFSGEAGLDGTHSNGVRFQDTPTWNGRQTGDDSGTEPKPGPGYNLTGATRLHGYIRCDQPNREVWLNVGCQTDSLAKLPVIAPKLTAQWQPFDIPLTGLDLSHVASGLSITYVANEQQVEPCDVYLDDIELDLPRHGTLHLIPSYEPHVSRDDPASRNVCHVYDNALAILAYLARGTEDDLRRARLLADALIYCREHNRTAQDGRIYNAYSSGDIPVHPGEPARLPGWWDSSKKKWLEDRYDVSSNTGNIAWVILALTACHEKTPGDMKYLDAAKALGDWLVTANHCIDPKRPLGFTGGLDGWTQGDRVGPGGIPHLQGQTKALYKSTEHNIDLVAAFGRLYLDTHDAKWLKLARNARDFVLQMFPQAENRFVTGTQVPDDQHPEDVLNLIPKPLDVNTWSMLVLGPNKQTQTGLDWVLKNCRVDDAAGDGYHGFAFKSGNALYIDEAEFGPCGCPEKPARDRERDGIWWEGTGQAVCALLMDRQAPLASEFLKQMEASQQGAPGGNGMGMVAASHDCLITGFELTAEGEGGRPFKVPWVYYRQVHLGASCWHIFAERNYNPYWGIALSSRVPEWDK